MRRFQKNKEDFTCEKCNFFVEGNGYTNHCSNCLWSKHVDINPGDRLAECKGMMEPISLDKKGDIFSVIHKCLKCDHQKKNKLVKGDSFDEAIKLLNKN